MHAIYLRLRALTVLRLSLSLSSTWHDLPFFWRSYRTTLHRRSVLPRLFIFVVISLAFYLVFNLFNDHQFFYRFVDSFLIMCSEKLRASFWSIQCSAILLRQLRSKPRDSFFLQSMKSLAYDIHILMRLLFVGRLLVASKSQLTVRWDVLELQPAWLWCLSSHSDRSIYFT